VALFPGICRDHVSNLYETISPTSDHMIAHILDRMDKGESYPSAKEITKSLKRKRDIDEDEEAVRKYGAVDRVVDIRGNIRQFM
jgi:TRIAD3 protein (E3 ubiquitin-protein ligase RNF216)